MRRNQRAGYRCRKVGLRIYFSRLEYSTPQSYSDSNGIHLESSTIGSYPIRCAAGARPAAQSVYGFSFNSPSIDDLTRIHPRQIVEIAGFIGVDRLPDRAPQCGSAGETFVQAPVRARIILRPSGAAVAPIEHLSGAAVTSAAEARLRLLDTSGARKPIRHVDDNPAEGAVAGSPLCCPISPSTSGLDIWIGDTRASAAERILLYPMKAAVEREVIAVNGFKLDLNRLAIHVTNQRQQVRL